VTTACGHGSAFVGVRSETAAIEGAVPRYACGGGWSGRGRFRSSRFWNPRRRDSSTALSRPNAHERKDVVVQHHDGGLDHVSRHSLRRLSAPEMAPDLYRRFPLNTKHPTGNVALWISQKGHHVFVIFLSNPMPSGTARKRNPSVCGLLSAYLASRSGGGPSLRCRHALGAPAIRGMG